MQFKLNPKIDAWASGRVLRLVAVAGLFLNISFLLVSDYIGRLDDFIQIPQSQYFGVDNFALQIARGDGIAPYRSRLLFPWVAISIDHVDNWTVNQLSLAQIHFCLYIFLIASSLVAIQRMLEAFGFSFAVSLSGALIFALLLPIGMRDHGYQPWSWVEIVLLPIFIERVMRGKSLWQLVALALLSSLNRETALFLPVIPLSVAVARGNLRSQRFLILAALSTTFVVFAVRIGLTTVWPGPTPLRELSLQEIWKWNREPERLAKARSNLIVLFSSLSLLAIIGVLRRRVRREAIYIFLFLSPLYLGIYVVYALWNEVRVLVPVAILILPISLSCFVNDSRQNFQVVNESSAFRSS
jgi:hypothetical protein